MDSGTKNFRQTFNIPLTDTITCTTSSADYICAGCLDDTLSVWKNASVNKDFNKQTILQFSGSMTGLIDMKFSADSTHLAVSSMDSVIRIWELESKQMSTIQCPVMSLWKIQYIKDLLVVAGDLGKVSFYDTTSKEITQKLDLGEVFLTSLTKSKSQSFLASGNSFGDLYIVNLENKNKTISLKPHYKSIKSLSFTEDSNKLLTASEDSTARVVDIYSQKVIASLEGHKQAISCIKADLTDSKIAYTCSFDKSLKSWDLRMKGCIDTFQTGGALWSLEILGKNVVAGGEKGVLSFYSLE